QPRSAWLPYTTLFRSTARQGSGGATAAGDRRAAHSRRGSVIAVSAGAAEVAGRDGGQLCSGSDRGGAARQGRSECAGVARVGLRSEEHTSELQSREKL